MKKQLLLLLVLLSVSLFAQVPQSEKDALIALYNATDGSNWNNNTNWDTAQPVENWSGVTVENGHVTKLQLYNNNLTGTLPIELQNLSELYKLSISYNNLSGTIPDLTGLSSLTQFYIGMNYFQFADFENEVASYIANVSSFWYNRMKKIDTEINYDIIIGDDYTFTMSAVSGTGVTYQWYKNDEIISGETNLTYTITNAQITDAANYTCKASSSLVPDLQIERNTIHIYDTILPADKNDLMMLYYATDGANWINNTNWNTSVPVHDWYGVEVEGNRVKSINLNNNNLVGTLPTQIGDLDYLQRLSLDGNIISGTIPTEIGNLTNLTGLFLNYNQFSGSIPSTIGNLTALTDLEFWNNQLTGSIPSTIGNLINLKVITLEQNQLSGSVPSSFANLTAMTSFWLNDNQLTGNVDGVFDNMPDLFYISISNNQIEGNVNLFNNVSALRGCWLNNNQLTSIDVRNGNNQNISNFNIQNNPNLTCVFVDDTTWSTTNWINVDTTTHFFETQQECDDLFTYVPDNNFEQELINLGYDDVLDDYVLTSNINTISNLNLDGKGISDITGIEDFIGLTELNCMNNTITSINTNNNVNLTSLLISSNSIGNIDLSHNQSLEIFYCGYNQLTSLNISANSNLQQLGFSGNQISSINFSNNPSLHYLNMSNNQLAIIDLSNLNILYFLNINENQLSNIDVSNNLNLTALFCDSNMISAIDISQNQQIYRFSCANNFLIDLNVNNNNNNNFTYFDSTNNPNLTCIYVDDATWSTTNWTNVDPASTFVETEADCTALATTELNLQNNLSVYPNPTTGIIQIENNTDNNINKIVVTNTLGQEVNIFKNNINNIDISHLPNAIYFINIFTKNNNMVTYKIVKK